MKRYKVYEIYNSQNIVEYVGETHRTIEQRLHEHVSLRKSKFYNRNDLLIRCIAEFNNRESALLLEGELKLKYNFEWTEKTVRISNGKKTGGLSFTKESRIKQSKIIRICPHCNLQGSGNTMFKWHFDNCRHKKG